MGLILSSIPGFADISDYVLLADDPALGVHVAHIAQNAAFGMVRTEIFPGIYSDGQTVSLPVSGVDGYAYGREELLYVWTTANSANPSTHWISGPDTLWFVNWKVDQTTGLVSSEEWYRKSGFDFQGTKSNDGMLLVFTIAQRQRTNIVVPVPPSYTSINVATIATDKPLTQVLAQSLNGNAKFAVLNTEIIYMGEFVNGNTVPTAVSPADGYAYGYSEMKFMHSVRWTTLGSTYKQPPWSQGQQGPWRSSVTGGTGAVVVSVDYIDENGAKNLFTNHGRVAVFAFCTRSGTPATAPLANSFAEQSVNLFMPGETLKASSVLTTKKNIDEAILTPEFFGPTTYSNGNTVPLPVSSVDGYTYARNELFYIWSWSDTDNGTGNNLRLPLIVGKIGDTTGIVALETWRFPPGGPQVDDDNTQCRISVLTVAIRQTSPPTFSTDSGGSSSPSSLSGETAPQPYDVWWSLPGAPAANTEYLIGKFNRAVAFPANFSGSSGKCLTNPTATATFTLKKNGSSCGTVVISTSGVFSFTTSGGTPLSFASGDYLTVVTPTVQDATLANAGFTVAGTR